MRSLYGVALTTAYLDTNIEHMIQTQRHTDRGFGKEFYLPIPVKKKRKTCTDRQTQQYLASHSITRTRNKGHCSFTLVCCEAAQRDIRT